MKIIGKWEPNTAKYANGELYRVGRIVVAKASWTQVRKDELPYSIYIELPGIKQPSERYATIDEAKARAERAVATWFAWVQEPYALPPSAS